MSSDNPSPAPPAPDAAGPPIRPASTVMMLRDTTDGVEVFMLRRTSQAVFGGGMYVFPGERVDDADGAGDEAYAVAAIRECFEESGVLYARQDETPVAADHPVFAEREAVHEGQALLPLLDRHGLRPATEQMVWIARWLTPKGELPRRFDTWFFVAAMPDGQSARHDDSETVASEWIRPVDALARAELGELTMFPPTIHQLQFLAGCPTVADALVAARRVGAPPLIEPKLRPGSDHIQRPGSRPIQVVLPGEPGYDDLP